MRGECPNPQPDCKYAGQGCFSDTHHLQWPSTLYKDALGKTFRELPVNKEQLCRQEHDERHQDSPPPRPPREIMTAAIAEYVMGLELGNGQE